MQIENYKSYKNDFEKFDKLQDEIFSKLQDDIFSLENEEKEVDVVYKKYEFLRNENAEDICSQVLKNHPHLCKEAVLKDILKSFNNTGSCNLYEVNN